MLLEGEWSADGSGYSLRVGEAFLGRIRQRGGDSPCASTWMVSLNGKFIREETDRDYAQALAEQLIVDEIERIKPLLERIKARLPPRECFCGQDCYSLWINWKVEKEIAGWTFNAPTPHARHRAALKRPK